MTAIDASLGFDDPPEVVNYSYGTDADADDDGYSRFFDNVADAFGKLITVSAGNGGLRAIGTPGIAHNVLSVANVNDKGTADPADDCIAPSSSAGPTPAGRKKPDLAAAGFQVATASRLGGFEEVTGTSYAAPAIAAAATRLIEQGLTDPRAVKAVVLNSADDYGAPGWDIDFGWGYFNAARAERERDQHVVDTLRDGTAAGRARFYVRRAARPSKATLVWHRHVVDATPPHARGSYLNDLDLYLYDETAGAMLDASVSPHDNVEQVSSRRAHAAVLVVEAQGTLHGDGEIFALAHSGGFEERRGPRVEVRIAAPEAIRAGSAFTVSATVVNPGDLRGHGYDVSLALPAGYALAEGSAIRTLGSLWPGEAAVVTWRVRAPVDARQPAGLRATARAIAYGLTWDATAGATTAIKIQ
jgi:hypothetical protein